MPVDVYNQTTAPVLPEQQPIVGAHMLPLLAIQPDYTRDFHVGGITIDRTKIAVVNGKRIAAPGDVFRVNPATGLWDLVSGTADDGSGRRYAMILHARDCTANNQSAPGLIRSQHVNKGALARPIPAALVGAGKQFEYMYASHVDTRG
jgi:hypothetical protein